MRQVVLTRIALTAGLLFALGAGAASPPGQKAAKAEKAAPSAEPVATANEPESNVRIGLTIVGDKESPIGLFITPWKNAYADKRLDRPALLLDEVPLPLDPDVFRRQISYYEVIAAYRKSVQPAEPPPPHP